MTDLLVRPGLVVPAAELQIHFVRSGGPGGQHGNKTSTKAVVRWNPGGSTALSDAQKTRFVARFGHRFTQSGDLLLTSEMSRSQRQNLNDCLDRLRGMIESTLQAPKSRKPTRPTTGSRIRRRRAKEHRAQKKQGRISRSDHDA